MYIVESGMVRIVSENRPVDMPELGEGEVFGEISLLDEAPRSASAIAKTSCRLFGFFQPDLFALIERDPKLGVKIVIRLARIMGTRFRRANENMELLVDQVQKLKSRVEERKE
jgi:CRP-like cAMP-binding protein